MSPEEARKYALDEVQKLAQNPDAEPEKLRLLLRGLGPDEDPPQVRVLRQILRRTKDEQVRTDCLAVLSKWITDASEVREDILRILKEPAQDDNPGVRDAVARALGESGDLRWLPVLATMLDDPQPAVRVQAAQAVCELLGWKPATPANDKEADAWQADLRDRLKPILEALAKFEEAAAAQLPPAAAPATPEK
jgi:HEAT repeat protein